jgi:hypothetical protein
LADDPASGWGVLLEHQTKRPAYRQRFKEKQIMFDINSTIAYQQEHQRDLIREAEAMRRANEVQSLVKAKRKAKPNRHLDLSKIWHWLV